MYIDKFNQEWIKDSLQKQPIYILNQCLDDLNHALRGEIKDINGDLLSMWLEDLIRIYYMCEDINLDEEFLVLYKNKINKTLNYIQNFLMGECHGD